jgi:hypothetical protein
MIQVRDTFQVKFGKIDAAVDHWNRLAAVVPAWPKGRDRYEVLTDLSGDMFALSTALHLDSDDAWHKMNATVLASPEYQEWFKLFKQYVEEGHREFHTVEAANPGWSGVGAIVVRTCFRALEWRVEETLELLRTYGAMLIDQGVGSRPRILTAGSGRLFNLIIEIEATDLKTWDDHRRGLFRDPQFQVWFRRLTACVSHGSHDFLKVAGPRD